MRSEVDHLGILRGAAAFANAQPANGNGVDNFLLQQLRGELSGQQDIELTRQIFFFMLQDPKTSSMLRDAVIKTEESRRQNEKKKDSILFGGDEFALALTHSLEDSDTTMPGLHMVGLFPLGDAQGYNRTANTQLEKDGTYDHDPKHQYLVVIHSHPCCVPNEVLGPSPIEERPGPNPGDLPIIFGDLVALVKERQKRTDDITHGRRPRFTEFPIHGVIQAGRSPAEPVRLMIYQESPLLASLDPDVYYSLLNKYNQRMRMAKSDDEIMALLREMGYKVAETEFSGKQFWGKANIFEAKNLSNLLGIFTQQPNEVNLRQFIDQH